MMILNLVAIALLSTPPLDGHQERLDFVQNVFTANLTRLEFGDFSFKTTRVTAESIDDAEEGASADLSEGTGKYVFDKANAKFSLQYTKEAIVEGTEELPNSQIAHKISNVQLLTDRLATCIDAGMVVDFKKKKIRSSVEIFADKDQGLFQTYFEFVLPYGQNFHDYKLLVDIQKAKSGQATVSECTLDVLHQGVRHAKLGFVYPNNVKRAYLLDMEKGGLPLEITETDSQDQLHSVTRFKDLTFVDDVCWIPLSVTMYRPHIGTARKIEITASQLKRKPSLDEFSLKFDDKYNVPDQTKDVIYYGISQFSFRRPLPIKTRSTPFDFKSRPVAGEMPPLPGEMIGSRSWIWTSIAIVAILAIPTFFAIRRRLL